MLREEVDRDLLGLVEEHEVRVAPRAELRLGEHEPLHHLVAVGHERRAEVLAHVERRERRVLAHVRVAVVEALLDRRHERLEDLGLLDLAQEAQHAAAHVLVRVVQVVAQRVAHEDHLGQQLARRVILRHDLPVEHDHLLELVVVRVDAEANDLHEHARHRLAAQHQHDRALERFHLDLRAREEHAACVRFVAVASAETSARAQARTLSSAFSRSFITSSCVSEVARSVLNNTVQIVGSAMAPTAAGALCRRKTAECARGACAHSIHSCRE